MKRVAVWSGTLAVAMAAAGCAPQQWLLRGVADELAGQAAQPEDDPLLARDAGAFYLKLSESVLARTPGHLPLAESVAAGFTQYAWAFVAFEADRIEGRDARAARQLRQRAARLYLRAQGHALAALERAQPGLLAALAETAPPGAVEPLRLPPYLAGLAYWGAAAWGAAIGLSTDQPARVAELPQARRLAALAWAAAPDHGQGALASLMGQFELARPGGSPTTALPYFDRAIALGGAHDPAPWLAKAEAIAQPAGDRAGFEQLVRQALAVPEPAGADLARVLMRQRAQWLLDTLEDRF